MTIKNLAVSVDHLARIEGHGNIRVVIEDGIVKDVKMNIVEPSRMFESMVVGRPYNEVPYIASRICGICSASHVVTDLLAIESIFAVEVSARTKALRELLLYGSYLQNHATHLFVFALPDFVGEQSMFPLSKTHPELFARALELKSLGNELCCAVGGRSVHPITAVVGGFTHEISPEEYRNFAARMDEMVPFAIELADTLNAFSVPALHTSGDMLAMTQEGTYPVCTSRVMRFAQGGTFAARDVHDSIEEHVVDHSAALFARRRDTQRPFMTCALARINTSWSSLSKTAKVSAAKVGLRPPETNPLRNNIAQAVEIVDALVRCAELCRALADTAREGGERMLTDTAQARADLCVSSQPVAFAVCAGRGIGVTEAPRGALFHDIELDAAGRVVAASIITPTAMNLANLEADMRALAEMLVEQGSSAEEIRLGIEMLVRAYDPCLSCSVH